MEEASMSCFNSELDNSELQRPQYSETSDYFRYRNCGQVAG